MSCGVPHGSVLGPLLFIIYTNDIPDCIENATTVLFAEDKSLELKMTDQNIIQTNCSKCLWIHIDDTLKWNIHIDKVKSHISSSLVAINKIKHSAPI